MASGDGVELRFAEAGAADADMQPSSETYRALAVYDKAAYKDGSSFS